MDLELDVANKNWNIMSLTKDFKSFWFDHFEVGIYELDIIVEYLNNSQYNRQHLIGIMDGGYFESKGDPFFIFLFRCDLKPRKPDYYRTSFSYLPT